jgi:hypothetical protein
VCQNNLLISRHYSTLYAALQSTSEGIFLEKKNYKQFVCLSLTINCITFIHKFLCICTVFMYVAHAVLHNNVSAQLWNVCKQHWNMFILNMCMNASGLEPGICPPPPPPRGFWNENQNWRKEGNIPNTVNHSYNGLTWGDRVSLITNVRCRREWKGIHRSTLQDTQPIHAINIRFMLGFFYLKYFF